MFKFHTGSNANGTTIQIHAIRVGIQSLTIRHLKSFRVEQLVFTMDTMFNFTNNIDQTNYAIGTNPIHNVIRNGNDWERIRRTQELLCVYPAIRGSDNVLLYETYN